MHCHGIINKGRINMNILKRVFTSEIKGIDEAERTLTAYISTDARDRMNESLDPSGVDMTNYRKNPVVLWAHDYSKPPIGKAMWVKRDGNGIISKVKFANTEMGNEIFQLYKDGFLKAFSVGFIPKETEDGDGEKKPRRTYKKWEMLEYSAVPVPANPEALTLAIQKGLKIDPAIKESIEKSFEQASDEWEESVQEQDEIGVQKTEQPIETKQADEVKPVVINPALEELQAENKQLNEKIVALEKESSDLRYQIYKSNQVTSANLSGITADNLANKVVEVIGGVIRKAQGKVE